MFILIYLLDRDFIHSSWTLIGFYLLVGLCMFSRDTILLNTSDMFLFLSPLGVWGTSYIGDPSASQYVTAFSSIRLVVLQT